MCVCVCVQTCGFSLAVSADTYLTANDQSVSGAQQSLFGSQVRKLQTGDRVLLTTSNCKYNFGLDQAYFGIYLLERGLSKIAEASQTLVMMGVRFVFSWR